MHHVLTLQRYSSHQNLKQVWCWPLSDFLTFWTRSCSNGSILQLIVNFDNASEFASCCNFIGSDVLLIRISAKLDVYLCVTFLNVQYNPKSNDLVNAIRTLKLHVACCSFTGVFSTSEFLPSFMLIFMQPFWTFSVVKSQAAMQTWYLLRICLHHVITLKRCSSHRTLGAVQYWPLWPF